jgi:hypothetical protein
VSTGAAAANEGSVAGTAAASAAGGAGFLVRRPRLRRAVPALAFSVIVVEEFAFWPTALATDPPELKQKAAAANAIANKKLLKRKIFVLMDCPPISFTAQGQLCANNVQIP